MLVPDSPGPGSPNQSPQEGRQPESSSSPLSNLSLPFAFRPGASPPIADREPHVLIEHGDQRIDNYYWMKDLKDPRVMQYLQAENRYCEATLAHTQSLQQELFAEFVSRSDDQEVSIPVKIGDNYYYSRSIPGKQYSVYCRAKGSPDGQAEVLLDLNDLAAGKGFLKLKDYTVSPDQRYLAYSTDRMGAEMLDIYVKDLQTGQLVAGPIPNGGGGLEWSADSTTILFTTRDDAKRICNVCRHLLGSPAASAELIYHEPNPVFEVAISKSHTEDHFLMDIYSYSTSEVRIAKADSAAQFAPLVQRQPGLEYNAVQIGARLFIRTNEGAPDFKVIEAPLTAPGAGNWKEIIPERPGVKIEKVHPFRDHLVVTEREDGLRKVRVLDLASGGEHTIAFPDDIYSVQVLSDQDCTGDKLYFSYATPLHPGGVYEYDLKQRTWTAIQEEKIPTDFDPSAYAAERTTVIGAGGAEIPVYLIYNKAMRDPAGSPVLLEAYGAYNTVLYETGFFTERQSLLDRGVVCAIAHVRGGGEKDTGWYHHGKLQEKRNTIDDFLACAEQLKKDVAGGEPIAASGISAGGMLMGASINFRPDLFKVVIAEVPFVDGITTMLDASIPLTTTEFEEWGDPKDRAVYDYIKSYSPYDNVKAQDYPALLITAGLHDSRVQYWEPAKWAAKLRSLKTDSNPLMLLTNMEAGHSGASGRDDDRRESALKYAFILDQLGLS